MSDQNQIKHEMDLVINELNAKGVKFNSKEHEIKGLGDALEETLTRFGITEERFKDWFGLKECNCSKRKKYLNNLFSWKKNKS
jgi:hypothetical protein